MDENETEEVVETELSLHDQVRAAVEAGEEPEQAAEKAVEEVAEEVVEETEEVAEAEEAEEEQEPLTAPAHWSQDDQTAFQGLSREAQDVVLKREKDFESDYTSKMQEISGVKAILDQNKQYFESLGTTPDAVLDYFINADKTLRTGMPEAKSQALLGVAQQYGINLGPVEQAPSQTEPGESQFYNEAGEPIDIAALVNQAIAPVQEQLGQVTNAFGQMLTTQQQTELNTVNAQIETFRTDKDESGALKHPHFDRLKPQIEHLAAYERSTGETPDLAKLYTSVCALDPQAREEMVTSQVASLNDKRKQDTEKKKLAAKAQITGSAESGPSASSKKDYKTAQDAARAAFEALTGD